MKKIYRNSLYFVAVLAIVACSATKNLGENQSLYTGADFEFSPDTIAKEQKETIKNEIEKQLKPKPNGSLFGMRPKVWIYQAIGEDKKQKGIKHWIKTKMGEKPVLLSDVPKDLNRKIAQTTTENLGYFNAKVSYDTVADGKKQTKIVYKIKPKNQYTIQRVSYPTDSTDLGKAIASTQEKSLLKVGNAFNFSTVKAERERINNELKELGYYYFSPDYLIVQIDSTVSKHKIDMLVRVKENTPPLAKNAYTIGNILVYPDYNLKNEKPILVETGNEAQKMRDTANVDYYKDLEIIDPNHRFKPQIFDRLIYFEKGDLYSRKEHNLSLNRLITLGPFKFVKNEFILRDTASQTFDVVYWLTPKPQKSIRLEVLGKTNSASYVGSEINLNWSHRNAFRGAELFKAKIYGGVDYQMGGNTESNNIYRLGAEMSLDIPRIVAPFKFTSSSAFVPKTRVKFGYEYQNRTSLYTLHNYSSSYSYIWKENARKEHNLSLIDIIFVTPENVTDKYRQEMQNNVSLQRVVEKQLIFGPTYTYTYTNSMTPQKHTFNYSGTIDLSGNLTGLLWGADVANGKQRKILGVPFSQYAKIENSFTHRIQLTNNTQFVSRVIAGVAYPYGNSEYVPFSKQFYVGGVNSIRAFRARTLGPGSFDPRTQKSTFLYDQSGDIKLELNAEYRAKLFSFLHAAAFVDAGNVWLINEDHTKPGGKISSDFYNELAVGAGVGLRFDFNILIFRTDLAFPIRIPYYEKGHRWNLNNIDFGDKNWRKENLILNIAVGYPF